MGLALGRDHGLGALPGEAVDVDDRHDEQALLPSVISESSPIGCGALVAAFEHVFTVRLSGRTQGRRNWGVR